MFDTLVLIRGAGDLGSGAAYRLIKAGFPVIMTELAQPLMVRSTVSYGTSVFYETVVIEGIIARHATPDQVPMFLDEGIIPVLVDPGGESITIFCPPVVVDARNGPTKPDTTIDDAALVIGLRADFSAGVDCHAVIETTRGHSLGRVVWQGRAEPETKQQPGSNNAPEHVLCAPVDGDLVEIVAIGDSVKAGDVVARVADVPILAPFDGVLRGLIDSMVPSGVVEAVLSAPQIRKIRNLNPTLVTATSSEAKL
jgi:xanthine dehydrogenase accessory factor